MRCTPRGQPLRIARRAEQQLRPGSRVRLRTVACPANVDNPNIELEALAAGITGYYRLEDADLDPIALQNGRPSASPTELSRKTSQGINMPDNIAFQPKSGNAIIHE